MSDFERVKRLARNVRGQDYVVGDVHGHFSLLERLLEQAGFDCNRDRLLSVGDLIDRGPESLRAREFLSQPWFHAVRGNHEQMMLDAVLGDGGADLLMRALWYQNGGEWFEGIAEGEKAGLIAAIRKLPYLLSVDLPNGGQAAVAHGDLPANDWERSVAAVADAEGQGPLLEQILWSRRRAGWVQRRLDGREGRWTRKRISLAGIERVFFGHTPMPVAVSCGNTRWIDTGVFLPRGRLSIVSLVDDQLWSISADDGKIFREWRVLADR